MSTYANDVGLIQPLYVKTITNPYQQYNDIDPAWSGNGEFISFERYNNFSHGIVIADREGKSLQSVYAQRQERVYSTPAISLHNNKSVRINSAISWSPNNTEFVFSSNGKNENFDLYIGNTDNWKTHRITFHPKKDSQPQWSPNGRYISFISTREEKAKLFLYDTQESEISLLLEHDLNVIYSRWSPDGEKIALMLGESNLYQIYVIDDLNQPQLSLRQITSLDHNSIRPSWSPDGDKLAFFINYHTKQKQVNWYIAVTQSEQITALTDTDLQNIFVAKHVIPNSHTGPTWLPDSEHIAYIKSSSNQYNPIYITDLENKQENLFNTNTHMNKDVVCSRDGTLVFQSQDKQWSRIFIAKLPENGV